MAHFNAEEHSWPQCSYNESILWSISYILPHRVLIMLMGELFRKINHLSMINLYILKVMFFFLIELKAYPIYHLLPSFLLSGRHYWGVGVSYLFISPRIAHKPSNKWISQTLSSYQAETILDLTHRLLNWYVSQNKSNNGPQENVWYIQQACVEFILQLSWCLPASSPGKLIMESDQW